MPLLRVDAAGRRGHAPDASLWAETLAGLRYAARHPGLGPILGFAAVASVLLRGVQEILPPYVERLFARGPDGPRAADREHRRGRARVGPLGREPRAPRRRDRPRRRRRRRAGGGDGGLRRDRRLPLRHALRRADGRGRLGARHLGADAGAERVRSRHARPRAQPVGHDRARLPGLRRARARDGRRAVRAAAADLLGDGARAAGRRVGLQPTAGHGGDAGRRAAGRRRGGGAERSARVLAAPGGAA